MIAADPSIPPLDVALLAGFDFSCRPDCGLCCYAAPRVSPSEQGRLAAAHPELRFLPEGRSGPAQLASRPEGGACQLLNGHRCGAHALRPLPCAMFPISVHATERFQATVVLSCPGVPLDPLLEWARAPEPPGPARGLDAERAAAEAHCRSPASQAELGAQRRNLARVRRHLERAGRWVEAGELRARLFEELPRPEPSDFPPEELPGISEALELLPIYFDGRPGPVALGGHPAGYELAELRPGGGIAAHLGVHAGPTRPPTLDPSADRLLAGYLAYWLWRDPLVPLVATAMAARPGGSTLLEEVALELRRIGATVLTRASVLANAAGRRASSLSEPDVSRGIRASDADLLDREW